MKNKICFYLTFLLFLSFIFIIILDVNSFAAYPKLVSTIVSAFDTLKTWIIRIAAPAAAVSVRNRSIYEKI